MGSELMTEPTEGRLPGTPKEEATCYAAADKYATLSFTNSVDGTGTAMNRVNTCTVLRKKWVASPGYHSLNISWAWAQLYIF